MRALMYAALMVATMAPAMAARAQQLEDQSLCTASTGVSREQRLESCTAVIKAGLGTPQNLAIAFNNRGNVYRNLKDYDRAIADYDRAIELNPKYALAFSNRGAAYRSKGRYDRAIEDYDRAIEIIPNNMGVPPALPGWQ
jgi:tetratricopeptide (TPR) repeat protein